MEKKGKLIIIEAGDGSGKATQTKALYEHLCREGYRVHRVEFPDYAADSSMLVRMYLRGDFGGHAEDVNAYAASTFFAVDRYASYRMKWKKAYEAGAIILADRYTTSNMVHQAVKLTDMEERESFLDWLWDFEFNKLGLPVPDKVVFLDMDPEVADRLIAARAVAQAQERDIHERDKEYLHRCHAAYEELAKKYGWTRVACSAPSRPSTPMSTRPLCRCSKVWNEERTRPGYGRARERNTMIKEVLVVEGKMDVVAIDKAVEADCIITEGFNLKPQALKNIEQAYKKRGIIIMTDPDSAGERIRKYLSRRFPEAKHAFVPVEEATDNDDIGIEQAKPDAIRKALAKVRTLDWEPKKTFTGADLIIHGLSGAADASVRRARLGEKLGLGFANAKTFLTRLNHYGVSREEFDRALEEMERENREQEESHE